MVVREQKIAVAKTWEDFGNREVEKRPPLEDVTRGLMKT
jgi:hypothetical protein